MKKRFLIILALGGLVIWQGCILQGEQGRYYNKKHGYSIKIPVGWKKTRKPLGLEVVSFVDYDASKEPDLKMTAPPTDSPFLAAINIGVLDEEEMKASNYSSDLDKYAEQVKAEYEEANLVAIDRRGSPRSKLIEEGYGTLGGRKAKWLFLEEKAFYGVELTYAIFTIVDNSNIYLVSFNVASNRYPKYKSILEESIKSFRFEK